MFTDTIGFHRKKNIQLNLPGDQSCLDDHNEHPRSCKADKSLASRMLCGGPISRITFSKFKPGR